MKAKSYCLTLILMLASTALSAQNLLDMSDWTPGNGATALFLRNGSFAENSREWGTGPHGERTVLWKATPDANVDADGGYNAPYVTIHARCECGCRWRV